MRPPDAPETRQMSKERNGLHGLAEPHFVRQYSVEFPLFHGDEPLQAHLLVLAQLAAQQEGELGLVAEGVVGGLRFCSSVTQLAWDDVQSGGTRGAGREGEQRGKGNREGRGTGGVLE